MQRSYQALNGVELATAIAKKATALALSIPGLNSRLTTFPRAKVTITVRIEAFDRAPAEVTDMDDLIESMVAQEISDGIDPLESLGITEHVATIDESEQPPDQIRKGAGLAVTKPTLNPETGQIVDVPADPLPAGENLSNVTQFGRPGGAMLADGTHYSGKGRVIEQETVGLTGANPVGPKLKGDGGASHFRVRNPG